jgi:hypothetical protein
MLTEFLAITEYCVFKIKAETEGFSAKKIAVKNSEKLDEILRGSIIFIGKRLIMRLRDGEQSFNLIALFPIPTELKWKVECEMGRCFLLHNGGNRNPEWDEETRKVLDAIGDNHQIFHIDRKEVLCLPICA